MIEGNGEETQYELLSHFIFPGVDTVAIYITYSFGLVDPAVQRVMPPLSFDQRLVLEFCVEKERPNPGCVFRQTFFSTEGFKIKRFVPKLTKIYVKTKLHRPLLVIFDNSKSRTIPTPRGQTVGLIVQRVTCTIVDITIICSKAVRHVSLETESEVERSYF